MLVAGALGGATGDQFWFYLLRGRIHWLDRYPKLGEVSRQRVSKQVHAHETLMILVGPLSAGPAHRHSGGVRVRRTCAREIPTLNLISAFAWAGAIMAASRAAPSRLSAFGLNAWWGPFIPGALLLLFISGSAARPARRGTRIEVGTAP